MIATKYSLDISVKALSKACFHSLVMKALAEIEDGYETGNVSADDGDNIQWGVITEEVKF